MHVDGTVLVKNKLNGSRVRIAKDQYDNLVLEGKKQSPPRGPELMANGLSCPIFLESDQDCEGDSLTEAKQKVAAAAG